MKNNYQFTYIIGYRHQNERFFNLKKVINWVLSFKNVELIIVEQDNKPKLNDYSLNGFKYIFTKSELPYNRSWAFNVGLKYASTDFIVCGDSDLVMELKDFVNSMKLLSKFDCVSPYSSVLDLTNEESNMEFNELSKIKRAGRGEKDNQKINLTGGIVFFRKNSLDKIGGWCEDFIGWGGEDDFQTLKVKKFLTWFECDGRCYHFYHQRIPPDHKYYKRTLELLNKFYKMDDQTLQRYIINSYNKIGLKNKYSY
jgi:glycosyltransferase involved in cell wall biosynthesis